MVDVEVPQWQVRLAVDFGALHTVAVVRRDGQQPRVLLFDGSPLLASGVYAGPDGVLHSGREAQRFAEVDPGGFDPHPKRGIDHEAVLLGRHERAPAALIGAVLARVAAAAAEAGVGPLDPAVLTCPARWGPRRRAVLRQAARQAGLRVVALVDEPTAAGTYCLEVLDVPVARSVGIFDLGGGTLDVAVVRREPDGVLVLATGGLDDLGGLDVDAAVVERLGTQIAARDPALWQRLQRPDDETSWRDRRALWAEARAAKEMLSRTSTAPVRLPGRTGAAHLTRDELNRLAEPLVDRAVDEFARLLRDNGIDPHALAGVFVVGGASRMPLVASRLHTRLGVVPTVPEQPELPVAFGALRAADMAAVDTAATDTAATDTALPPAVDAAPPAAVDTVPSPEVDGASPTAGPVPEPAPTGAGRVGRNRLLAVAAVLVVVALVAGLLWWNGDRRPIDGVAAGLGHSSGATGSAAPTVSPSASTAQPSPDGFAACGDGRFCPTTPVCWINSLVYYQNTVTVLTKSCDEPHGRETFVAGYQPPGTGTNTTDAVQALQSHPEIKRLCAMEVLRSRLRDPATSGPWEIVAMPIDRGLVHCIASRAGDFRRTTPLFRTGP